MMEMKDQRQRMKNRRDVGGCRLVVNGMDTLKHIENNTSVRGNTRFISSVELDIRFNTRNKSGISKHSCIIKMD